MWSYCIFNKNEYIYFFFNSYSNVLLFSITIHLLSYIPYSPYTISIARLYHQQFGFNYLFTELLCCHFYERSASVWWKQIKELELLILSREWFKTENTLSKTLTHKGISQFEIEQMFDTNKRFPKMKWWFESWAIRYKRFARRLYFRNGSTSI